LYQQRISRPKNWPKNAKLQNKQKAAPKSERQQAAENRLVERYEKTMNRCKYKKTGPHFTTLPGTL